MATGVASKDQHLKYEWRRAGARRHTDHHRQLHRGFTGLRSGTAEALDVSGDSSGEVGQFLYVGAGQWRLSPVFDVNPALDRNLHLETAILDGGAHDRSISLALAACEFFEIPAEEARRMVRDTARCISEGWREALRQVGVSGALARDYEPAFAHAKTEVARRIS